MLFFAAVVLGPVLSVVIAAPSATDPCVKIAGNASVAPADARACLTSFPLNDTVKRNVLDVHQKVLNFYTFEDYALNSPPPFQESTVNIRAELARISSQHNLTHLSQRIFDTCPPYEVPVPKTPPFPFANLAIIGNGICASTCALFSTAMVERHNVKSLMFVPSPVLEWTDLDSEVKTALLKEDPLAPPDLLINGNLRHNWRIAYSFRYEKIPIAYESERAQFRFPYNNNETYNQPQKLWEFAASKLF